MDIKVVKDEIEGKNYFETYAREQLQKYFKKYPFIESINVFFRGKNHPYKKVKLHVNMKGKELFVEARGDRHDLAIDAAGQKLYNQMEKYKGKLYNKAS
jgi:ribosome-associated translation inhibitor RaiA